MAFKFQTNDQTERQNNIMKVYFQVLVNYKQNDWAKLLPMAKFAYNNVKNTYTDHIFFDFNYGLRL